jgi:hypothetical protein
MTGDKELTMNKFITEILDFYFTALTVKGNEIEMKI